MEKALGIPKPAKAILITDGTMKFNATAAVKRGAEWLDRNHVGWVTRAQPRVLPPSETKNPIGEQVGLLPFITDEVLAVLKADPVAYTAQQEENKPRILAREGDQRYTPLFTEQEHAMGASFLAATLGMPVPQQDEYANRENQIDLAWYGFTVFWMVIGFGEPSGTKPTAAQLKSTGYCKDKAMEYVVEAWNAELEQRRGK